MARESLAARSIAALALMVGFYALAVAMVLGLLAIPYAEWVYGERIHIRILAGCVIGAAVIAWSILPRWDRFDDPGPRLTPEAQPELFEKVESVARATGQEMPRAVFLVQDMNAWVANRGGVMGIGSHRVMGLGLPLLQVLGVKEFEAVLAHEFGHYHGGDTRLGPWIYKTRAAIGRTLESLGEEGWLHLPFRWYGNFFLGVTQAISRAQEFTADQLAAMVVGAKSLVEGLKKIHALAPAYDAYWEQEAIPVLSSGFRVPLAVGFDRFLHSPRIEQAVHGSLEQALTAEGDRYDSHPPLGQRISAVEDLSEQTTDIPDDSRPAIALLDDVDSCEQALIAFLAQAGKDFQAISWSDVTERVLMPGWRGQAADLHQVLEGATLADLPELVSRRGQELAQHFYGQEGVEIPDPYVPEILAGPLGSGILCALSSTGWTVAADVGDVVTLRHGDTVLEPFSVVTHIAEGDEGAAWWSGWVREHGVAALPLAAPPTPDAGSAPIS